MHWRRGWLRTFPWLNRGRVDRDLSRELALHLALETRENLERGMAPEEAARAARVSLGNVPAIREDAREVWGWRWLDASVRSLAQAFRSFRRTPGFSFVAMGVLAVGIGLNTAIFSVVYGVLMRPLPYPDPDSIVVIHMRDHRTGNTTSGFSWLDFRDWVARSRSFDALALSQGALAAVDGAAGYEQFDGWTVSGAFFEVFGNALLIGRGLTDPRAPEAVISRGLWQEQFGADPAALGRPITVNGDTYAIVGVARPDFRVPAPAASATLVAEGSTLAAPDVWFPVRPSDNRRNRLTHLVGRLRPGVTLAQAQDEAGAVARAIAAEHTPDRSAEPVVTLLADAGVAGTQGDRRIPQPPVRRVGGGRTVSRGRRWRDRRGARAWRRLARPDDRRSGLDAGIGGAGGRAGPHVCRRNLDRRRAVRRAAHRSARPAFGFRTARRDGVGPLVGGAPRPPSAGRRGDGADCHLGGAARRRRAVVEELRTADRGGSRRRDRPWRQWGRRTACRRTRRACRSTSRTRRRRSARVASTG